MSKIVYNIHENTFHEIWVFIPKHYILFVSVSCVPSAVLSVPGVGDRWDKYRKFFWADIYINVFEILNGNGSKT